MSVILEEANLPFIIMPTFHMETNYSKTSVARTRMTRLTQLFRTRSS